MSNYYYLVSSLPMIVLGDPPPMSRQEFLDACEHWLTPADLETLSAVSALPPMMEASVAAQRAAKMWFAWETALRNRLARSRATRIGKDPETSTRPDTDFFSDAERAAGDANSAADPLARERILDMARWRVLDNIELGHQFDFDKLCIYKVRLELAEKWVPRLPKKGVENLDSILTGLYSC